MPQSLLLCRLDELPDGSARGFDPRIGGPGTVFLVRRGGHVVAYRDLCPHIDGAPMAWRKGAYLNGDGSRIVCHAHGAQFDIAGGVCLAGPCLGQRLTPVTLGVRDGEVWLDTSPLERSA